MNYGITIYLAISRKVVNVQSSAAVFSNFSFILKHIFVF